MSAIVKGVSDFFRITSPPQPNPPRPTAPTTSKRKASQGPYPSARFTRLSGVSTAQDYRHAPYHGSVTITTTDDESSDGQYPQLRRVRLKNKPRTNTTTSEKAAALREMIRNAAEARVLRAQAEKSGAHVDSEGEEKQRAGPIEEYQPYDFLSGTDSELDTLLKDPVTTEPQHHIPDSDLETFSDSPVTKEPSPKLPQKRSSPPKTTSAASQRPDDWRTFSAEQKWKSRPNLRARELAHAHEFEAQETIQMDINEPEYALRDVEVRDSMWQIMDQIEKFAKDYFGCLLRPNVSETWYEQLSPQTAKIISCVASGGPAGQQGWHDLFLDEQKRRALVCAIIGNVLVEQLFQHIYFGGEKKDIDEVAALQEKNRDKDGFVRNKLYADTIARDLKKHKRHDKHVEMPRSFLTHVNHIAAALQTHLAPFFMRHRSKTVPSKILDPLCNIVTMAGILSLQMRLDPHTVYYFEPVFKDETFTSERMECFNFHQMQQQHPRPTTAELEMLDEAEKQRRATLSDAEKQRARSDSPLTQITLMPAVCAYRFGGWEQPTSTLASPEYEKPEYQSQGVRSRLLTRAWVYCRWGRERRFDKGVPADNPKVHGAAWDGGFVEFTDLPGVYPWLAMERKEKAAAARAREKAARSTAKGKGKATAPVEIARAGPSGTRGSRRSAQRR